MYPKNYQNLLYQKTNNNAAYFFSSLYSENLIKTMTTHLHYYHTHKNKNKKKIQKKREKQKKQQKKIYIYITLIQVKTQNSKFYAKKKIQNYMRNVRITQTFK